MTPLHAFLKFCSFLRNVTKYSTPDSYLPPWDKYAPLQRDLMTYSKKNDYI